MNDEEQVNNKSGLTPSEERVMSLLVAAWNAWVQQDDVIATEEMQQFRAGIHMAQQVLADRALHRAYPIYWTDPQQTRNVSLPTIHVSSDVSPKQMKNIVVAEIDRKLRSKK